MEISIGSSKLSYITQENKYIITYITKYNNEINNYLSNIFDAIFPLYNNNKLAHANVCGANATIICKQLKINRHKPGKIIITDWVSPINPSVIRSIESVYGPVGLTIDSTYHALVYLEITLNQTYYVAIETTICHPYTLQFYVGNTAEELKKMLKIRYQCNDYKISLDCDEIWQKIAYAGGKTKKRKYKYKKHSKHNKKHSKHNKHNKKSRKSRRLK